MKITLQDLKTAESALVKILIADLEFKLAYRLKKIAKKVTTELQDFEEERVKIVKKYGEKQLNGNYQVKPENIETYQAEVKEALKTEVDLDIQPIPYELLEKIEVKLSAIDIANLDKFIGEKELAKAEVPKKVGTE